VVKVPRLDAAEALLGQPRNPEFDVVHGQPPAQHRRVSPETPHPEAVTENRRRALLVKLLIGLRQQPAQHRADAQRGQSVAGDPLRTHPFQRPRVVENRGIKRSPHGHPEQFHLPAGRLAKPLEQWIAEAIVLRPRARHSSQRLVREPDEPVWLRHRQRTQHQRVDQRERRGAGAHGEGKRKHRRRRDPSFLGQDAEPEAGVLK
jgi:hypothetical protein